MRKKALSFSTQRHGHFKLHLVSQVTVIMFYFESNKYYPII